MNLPSREEWTQVLIERHGLLLQQIFAKSTVAICGLGGLGSHIAIALARAGIGHLILIDFDRVELSNLHRQHYKPTQIGQYKTEALAENLREIAPYVELTTCHLRITEECFLKEGCFLKKECLDAEECWESNHGSESTMDSPLLCTLFDDADVICEAFDDAEAKAMLANHVLELWPGKYLVAASGMAGMGSPNAIHTRRITKRFYLCGDEVSDVADATSNLKGLLAPRVMLCAAHQAQTVLRILSGEPDV